MSLFQNRAELIIIQWMQMKFEIIGVILVYKLSLSTLNEMRLAILVSPKFYEKVKFHLKNGEENPDPPLANLNIAIFGYVSRWFLSIKYALDIWSFPSNKSFSALRLYRKL